MFETSNKLNKKIDKMTKFTHF